MRFLVLVFAIESLTTPMPKHPVAANLLLRWRAELEAEMKKHDSSSGAFDGLGAILRELNFRADDFIRSQVRKLFATLPGYSHEDADALQRRAVLVYDKRSALVHDGHLPGEDIRALEREARHLLETVLRAVTNLGPQAV